MNLPSDTYVVSSKVEIWNNGRDSSSGITGKAGSKGVGAAGLGAAATWGSPYVITSVFSM